MAYQYYTLKAREPEHVFCQHVLSQHVLTNMCYFTSTNYQIITYLNTINCINNSLAISLHQLCSMCFSYNNANDNF